MSVGGQIITECKRCGTVCSDTTLQHKCKSGHMANNGLSKLAEECAELIVVKEKIDGAGHTGIHWDGQNLKKSLADEVADVIASTIFVATNFEFDWNWKRIERKVKLYCYWDNGGKEISVPCKCGDVEANHPCKDLLGTDCNCRRFVEMSVEHPALVLLAKGHFDLYGE